MKNTQRKIKVMFITPYFPPNIGGVQNYVYNIAKGFSKTEGWDIVIITSTKNNKIEIEKTKDMLIYRLPTLFVFSNTPINPFWYFQIKNIIEKEKPDLINAHSPVPFMADISVIASGTIPFILTYHSGTMGKKIFILDLFINIYEKFLFPFTVNRTKRVICSSNFVKTTVMKNFINKSTVVHPGVDTMQFKPGKKENTEKSVLFIGRQKSYEMKGLYQLIDAMKMLPDVNLKIIGEKMYTEQKNIKFLGIKTGNHLVKEIQNSTVLVLASLAHTESFGMVIIEAMACGIPVIGTDIGGIPETIVNGQDGIIVPPANSEALASAIRSIVNDPELARRMGKSGYYKVRKEFNWESRIRKTKEIFSQYI
ncbi:MAG: glycosyltransferase family 4 protein [Candidatus Woykebacteria bacterium]